ncbi:MAG: molybdopterin-dependent oxidoreductase [Gammaproteobacteria bacterium]|nr:molybdopterin-dependent oxidoreductase [Gammaproteobacteria bacterium]
MSGFKVNRRDFLRVLGWGGASTALVGCDMPTTVTLEEGKEDVVAYFMPEEYVIPGVGVWYASTCTQCAAGCGIHGRVREGRALKLEGNPESVINRGKTCMMGQAGVQAHYNPDRLTQPLMREGGALKPASWEVALKKIAEKTASANGDRVAWLSGAVSGHQAVLINDVLNTFGSKQHFVHETIHASVWQAVARDMLGDAQPVLRMDKAKSILSFGADFLGTWQSPVHFATQYAKFRSGKRGVLIQVEPKMSLTGGSADAWVAVRPGTEGILALGIAQNLVKRGWAKGEVPAKLKEVLAKYELGMVANATGVAGDRIQRITAALKDHAPSLVLAGAPVEGGENGYDAVSAVMLLNILLGNIGQTIEPAAQFAEARMQARSGGTRGALEFSKLAAAKKLDVAFISHANPVYHAPGFMKMKDAMANVGFKVVMTQFPDETAMQADVVLPLYSAIEDWGTHVAAYNGGVATLSFQQPLMEPLYKDTRGFGDVALSLLKQRKPKEYAAFNDYYAYLKASVSNMPAAVAKGDKNKDAAWNALLQKGVLETKATVGKFKVNTATVAAVADVSADVQFPYRLLPSARLGLWDGRHANSPWLQESPDQISKVVWGSWVEMHPVTAAKLGVKSGDYVRVTSAQGSLEAQAYVFNGIHPEAIAVPLGQGHQEYGRYAKGLGVNPYAILNPVIEKKTGEVAAYATRVSVTKLDKSARLVHMGSSDTQMGRKLVSTIPATVYRRTEGEA